MSKTIKALCALGFVATVSACGSKAPEEEFVVVEPTPITVEPTYTGKYK